MSTESQALAAPPARTTDNTRHPEDANAAAEAARLRLSQAGQPERTPSPTTPLAGSREATTGSAAGAASGHVEFPNPYPTGTSEHSATAAGSDHTGAAADRPSTTGGQQRSSWTMAVDLTTNLSPPGHPNEYGAERQFRALQDMVHDTAGKPDVSFVVQIARQPEHHGAGADEGQPPTASTVDRYLIRDGHMEQIGSSPSRGMAGNMEDLLRTAGQVAPSDHIGLVAQSHGAGAMGVMGDSGGATMPEITQAVRNGLSGSGHDRLDVLDFDSCMMGNTGALAQAQGVADHVVASEEPEAAAGNNDGQRLPAVFSDLLRDPSMTPAQLSDDFVHQADRNANGPPAPDENGHLHAGTDTLASFDSSHYPQYQQALNDLGRTLSGAMADPKNAQAIHDMIDHMPQTPLEPMPGTPTGDRDVAGLVQSLHQAIANGKITDRDGSIGTAADRLLQAEKGMTQFHGEQAGGYDHLSGLSVYLPGSDITDPAKRAEAASQLNMLRQMAGDTGNGNSMPPDKFRGMPAEVADGLSRGLSSDAQQQFAPVLEAAHHIQDAHTVEEFRAASAKLTTALDGIKGTAAEREIRQKELEMAQRYTGNFISDGAISGADDWNAFVRRLVPSGA